MQALWTQLVLEMLVLVTVLMDFSPQTYRYKNITLFL